MQAHYDEVKERSLKVWDELLRAEWRATSTGKSFKRPAISNAQYFIDELNFYLEFTAEEIASQTNLPLQTIQDLIAGHEHILSVDQFSKLVCFYGAARREQILPLCRLQQLGSHNDTAFLEKRI